MDRHNILVCIKPQYIRNTEVFAGAKIPEDPDDIYNDCEQERDWLPEDMPGILGIRENSTLDEAKQWAMDYFKQKADPKIFQYIVIGEYELV